MLPLDKGRAMEKLVDEARARWRVTVMDYRTGVPAVYDQRELDRIEAEAAAVRQFEEQHPDCNQYGETHGLEGPAKAVHRT